ncbi:MAG: DUF1016 N-terminal domain-containing protein [Atopobiaceae bacterium]
MCANSIASLRSMRTFYNAFPIRDTACRELSWPHYRRLMRIPDRERRELSIHAAAEEGLRVCQIRAAS